MQNKVQIVKVRRIGKNAEQVFHAPSVISGYYAMHYDEVTGIVRYEPVKV